MLVKMATKCMVGLFKIEASLNKFSTLQSRFIHTTYPCYEVTSGKVRRTPKRDRPINYEKSLKPFNIGHRKSWNSWNTTTIEGGLRVPETVFDDIFIRKFITGTFHNMVYSEVIIKRQHNIIRIAMILHPKLSSSGLCFLIGYTEELLSYWFQSIVKLEIQTIKSPEDVIFQYV